MLTVAPSLSDLRPPSPTADDLKVRARRQGRYVALEWLRKNSTRNGAKTCMHALGVGVSVGSTAAGVVHVGGVGRCGSPWACSNCSPTIGERRAAEIDAAIAAWRALGGAVYFVTATLKHKKGDDLDELLSMLQGAWSRTWRFKDRPDWYGGQIRAIEITHGVAAFHPHIHTAVFIEPGWDGPEMLTELKAHAIEWAESVHLYGGSTRIRPVRDVLTGAITIPGWDVRPITDASALSNYLTKIEGGWCPGLELARLDLKNSSKGETPFQLLAQAVAGNQASAALFKVYEIATAGKNRIVASPGLMARCGVEMKTDDEAAEAELLDDLAVLVLVPAPDWAKIMAAGFTGRLLDDVADYGRDPRCGWPWPPDWLQPLQPAAAAGV